MNWKLGTVFGLLILTASLTACAGKPASDTSGDAMEKSGDAMEEPAGGAMEEPAGGAMEETEGGAMEEPADAPQ